MIRVKVSTFSREWPLVRQTPGSAGVWGNCQFAVDDDSDDCDVWAVVSDLTVAQSAICPSANTIFFAGEPPQNRRYDERFLSQFATVISCQRGLPHPHVVHDQQAFPWHIGRRQKNHANLGFRFDYSQLKGMTEIGKEKCISAVCSAMTLTRGHRQRLRFVERLKERLGDQLDLFGRGIREVEDKWDAIAPYKYHVAIENSAYADYWTEKLSDALLGGALPLYYGCPNIGQYFPFGSLVTIDIHDFEKSLDIIQGAISNGEYERRRNLVWEARNKVLDDYNVFAVLARLASAMRLDGHKQRISLRPESSFPVPAHQRYYRILRGAMGGVKRWLRK